MTAVEKLNDKDSKILASVNSYGEVELYAGKRKLGGGKLSSLLRRCLLMVYRSEGMKEGGTVGDYQDEFAFDGEIKKVKIKNKIKKLMSFINDDFLLSNDYAVRLYHEYAKDEPILDFHNHLSPEEISIDRRFPILPKYGSSVIIINGVPYGRMEYLKNSSPGMGMQKKNTSCLGKDNSSYLGNPLYHWTHLELKRCFDIDLLLSPETAEEIWEQANKKLAESNFSARG